MASGGGGIHYTSFLCFRRTACASVLLRLALLIVSFPGLISAAQSPGASAGDDGLTPESVQRLRDRLELRRDLADGMRQDLLKHYDAAIDWLSQTKSLREETSRLERDREAAPAELEVARAETPPPTDASIEPPADATLEQLRQLRDQAEATLAQAQKRVTELEEEQARRTARRAEIPAQTARAQEDLSEAQQALAALDSQPRVGDSADSLAARQIELRSRIAWLRQFLAASAAEIANADARVELNQFIRERAAKRVATAEKTEREWRDLVSRTEQENAAAEATAARQTAAMAHPAVHESADRNVKLLERLSGTPGGAAGLLARKAHVQADLEQLNRQLLQVRATFERETRTARLSSLSDVIDIRLRRLRQELPDIEDLQSELAASRVEFAAIQQELANVEYERDLLPETDREKQAVLGGLDPTLTRDVREAIAAELDRQNQRRRSLYDSLIKEYTEFSDWLLRLQDSQVRLIDQTQKLRAFIDERILWIRSMPAISAADVSGIVKDSQSLFAPSILAELGLRLWNDARSYPGIVAWWIIVLLAIFVLRTFLSRRLRQLGDRVRNVYDDRFSYTLGALLITAILAAFWPVVLWFIAWRLNPGDNEPRFVVAHATGLNRAGVALLVFQFYRQLCKNRGLGDAHFNWRELIRRLLARNLLLFVIVIVPLAYVIAAGESYSNEPGSDPLGRAAFLLGMITMTMFAARVIHPGTGVLDGVLNRARNGWAWQTRYVWYASVVSLPVALGVMAAMGYYYSALQLERRLVITLWLILGLIVFNGLVLRWLMIVRRSLALEEAKKRRVASTPESGTASAALAADAPLVMDQPKLDLNAIGAQTRRLLYSAVAFGLVLGVWFIWIDLLPALGVLKRVEVWPTMRIVASEVESSSSDPLRLALVPATPASNSPSTQPSSLSVSSALSAASGVTTITNSPPSSEAGQQDRITLLNLLTFLAALLAMYVIARNIPGLLEITLLQWFTMEPSARYATATIARYLIVIVGLGMAFQFVGIGWSKVQWLAAAITLGIGFGLQEIFANFISGLILLFEQPIRVGDTVTVNGVDGTVTRIRMRATTITDYDRRELVIPNKAFITGQIVNWTLTDAVTRMVFPIGVAYGTDTALVERILLQIAKANSLVLDDPAPQAVFTGFGDSTLNFSFRVFLPNLDNSLRVRHEVNTAIDRVFREAGIELAFPQRDIHIRSTPHRPMQARGSDPRGASHS